MIKVSLSYTLTNTNMGETKDMAELLPLSEQTSSIIQRYGELKISDLENKEEVKAVETAKKDIQAFLRQVEVVRKALVEDSVAWQRKVNSTAKAIKAEVDPTLSKVLGLVQSIEDHKHRKRLEKEEKENAELNNRVAELSQYGLRLPDLMKLKLMTKEEFNELVVATAKLAEMEKQRAEENLNKMRALEAENNRIKEALKKQQPAPVEQPKPTPISEKSDLESFQALVGEIKRLNVLPSTEKGRALNVKFNTLKAKLITFIEDNYGNL